MKRLFKTPSHLLALPPAPCTRPRPSHPSDLDPSDLDLLDLPPVSLPTVFAEDNIQLPLVADSDITPDPEYQVIENATSRGKPKLIDSLGYSYTLGRPCKNSVKWRCAVRNSKTSCSASVTQCGETFTRGPHRHNHSSDPGAAPNARIRREVKAQAAQEIFEPALNIVESVIRKEQQAHGIRPGLPKLHNLTRVANLHRQQMRPTDPTDLDFEYDNDFLPDFLVGDIKAGDKRHLMFATRQQLTLLASARSWYLDGTFKIVKDPFVQLWSIHAFIVNGEHTKQLPFVYVLMSSRRTVDYVAIFDHLNTILPTAPQVNAMVLDFELALWKAIQQVYPSVVIRGCAFHWTQAVWRKIQGVGLQSSYTQDVAIHHLCKQLLGLPFIPADHIRPVFNTLKLRAATLSLQEVTGYIEDTWIDSTMWAPETWSVFGQSIRTNNDVEGWHHRLNTKAKKGNLPFYMLLQLLHQESEIVQINLVLIHEHRLRRYQKTKYRELQGNIFEAWEKYVEGTLSVTQLLDTCGQMYTPTQD